MYEVFTLHISNRFLKFQTVHTGGSKISKNVLAMCQYFNHFYSLKYSGYLTISYLLCLVFSSSQKHLLLFWLILFRGWGKHCRWWSTCCVPCNFACLFQVNFGFLFFIGWILNRKLRKQTEAQKGCGFWVPSGAQIVFSCLCLL